MNNYEHDFDRDIYIFNESGKYSFSEDDGRIIGWIFLILGVLIIFALI